MALAIEMNPLELGLLSLVRKIDTALNPPTISGEEPSVLRMKAWEVEDDLKTWGFRGLAALGGVFVGATLWEIAQAKHAAALLHPVGHDGGPNPLVGALDYLSYHLPGLDPSVNQPMLMPAETPDHHRYVLTPAVAETVQPPEEQLAGDRWWMEPEFDHLAPGVAEALAQPIAEGSKVTVSAVAESLKPFEQWTEDGAWIEFSDPFGHSYGTAELTTMDGDSYLVIDGYFRDRNRARFFPALIPVDADGKLGEPEALAIASESVLPGTPDATTVQVWGGIRADGKGGLVARPDNENAKEAESELAVIATGNSRIVMINNHTDDRLVPVVGIKNGEGSGAILPTPTPAPEASSNPLKQLADRFLASAKDIWKTLTAGVKVAEAGGLPVVESTATPEPTATAVVWNGEGQIPDMSNRPGEIPMKVVILNTPDTNFGGTDVYYGFIGGLLLVSSQDIGPGIQEYVFRRRISSTAENYFRIRGMYGERPDSLRRWTDIPRNQPRYCVGDGVALSVMGLLNEAIPTTPLPEAFAQVLSPLGIRLQEEVETYFRTGQHPTDWPVDSDGVVDLRNVIIRAQIQQIPNCIAWIITPTPTP